MAGKFTEHVIGCVAESFVDWRRGISEWSLADFNAAIRKNTKPTTGGFRRARLVQSLSGIDLRFGLRHAVLSFVDLLFCGIRRRFIAVCDARTPTIRCRQCFPLSLSGAQLRKANLMFSNLAYDCLREAELRKADLDQAHVDE